jgi:hypothetical protein
VITSGSQLTPWVFPLLVSAPGAPSLWYLSEELDVLLEMVDKVRVDLLPGRVHRSQEGDGVHLVQGVEHTCQQTELVSGTNILQYMYAFCSERMLVSCHRCVASLVCDKVERENRWKRIVHKMNIFVTSL